MTNPTLERAARAVAKYIEQCAAGGMTYQGLARAVLMAVREPDEETVETLFQARDGFVDRQDIAPIHRLVIDLALGESNETDDLTKSAVVTA